jgi:hypothetical protein
MARNETNLLTAILPDVTGLSCRWRRLVQGRGDGDQLDGPVEEYTESVPTMSGLDLGTEDLGVGLLEECPDDGARST